MSNISGSIPLFADAVVEEGISSAEWGGSDSMLTTMKKKVVKLRGKARRRAKQRCDRCRAMTVFNVRRTMSVTDSAWAVKRDRECDSCGHSLDTIELPVKVVEELKEYAKMWKSHARLVASARRKGKDDDDE